ncbi:MAG: hypothetical protein H6828_07050 [Planctomycetes bacterium]|nr:hypothetical protein [Planctomycetota bacterium]
MPAPSGRAIYSRVPIVDYYFGGGELHEGDDAAARMQVQNRFYGVDAPQDDQRVRVIVKTIDSNGNETTSEGRSATTASRSGSSAEGSRRRARRPCEKRFVVKTDLDRLKHVESGGWIEVGGDACIFILSTDGERIAAIDPCGAQQGRLPRPRRLGWSRSTREGCEGEACDPAPRAGRST